MDNNERRRGQPVQVYMIIVTILMLVGIVCIWAAFAEGNNIVLYAGLCLTGVGVSLGLMHVILRNRTASNKRAGGLSGVTR
jgi:cyanate permease